MKNVLVIKAKEELDIASLKRGKIHRIQIHISANSLGVPWRLPLIVIRGERKGPVLGLTAALHGDELNGISTIFKLVEEIDPRKLSGTLVMAPICNIPGYLTNQRYFSDNTDLNRIMPGKPDGSAAEVYAHFLTDKIIRKFDYLLDLHTASHGRVNSLYLRADLGDERTRTLAYLQNPQIIVNKYEENGTLRGWASENGIPAITVEIGNPNLFQHKLIDESLEGIINTMRHLEMISGKVRDMVADAVICNHSYWIRSKRGGIVDVFPKLADRVKKSDPIATIFDVFGREIETITADRDGIVIGKNTLPNCDAGARILHLGVDIIIPKQASIPGA